MWNGKEKTKGGNRKSIQNSISLGNRRKVLLTGILRSHCGKKEIKLGIRTGLEDKSGSGDGSRAESLSLVEGEN